VIDVIQVMPSTLATLGVVVMIAAALTALSPPVILSASRSSQLGPQAEGAGLGEYRFGMTREEVRRVPSCTPYQVVPGTKGLECPNFNLDGRKLNISFLFSDDRLSRIQLWFYEGGSETQAREATAVMLAYLSKRGPLRSTLPEGSPPTPDAIFRALRDPSAGTQGARVQVLTPPTSNPPFIHGSITRVVTGYYVFLFFSANPPAQK
jgi:hypothetical protein